MNNRTGRQPRHIAIIMDGNGRWAQAQGLSRLEGHRAGAEAVRRVTTAAAELGLEYLTLYAFSRENWRRPRREIQGLMRYLKEYLRTELPLMVRHNIRLRAIGRIEEFPASVRKALAATIAATDSHTGMTLTLALNYGGRTEITDAVRKIAGEVQRGELRLEEITEELVSSRLNDPELPDPDLLIRTSGELRVSNFLLWQISYTEFWLTADYWPDFDREHLLAAIADFQKRERRFGGLGSDEPLPPKRDASPLQPGGGRQ